MRLYQVRPARPASSRPGHRFVGSQNDDLSVRNGAPGGKELFAQMREYAKVLLSLVARRENQTELTRKLLEELSAEFPANPLFHRELALVK